MTVHYLCLIVEVLETNEGELGEERARSSIQGRFGEIDETSEDWHESM